MVEQKKSCTTQEIKAMTEDERLFSNLEHTVEVHAGVNQAEFRSILFNNNDVGIDSTVKFTVQDAETGEVYAEDLQAHRPDANSSDTDEVVVQFNFEEASDVTFCAELMDIRVYEG